MNNEKCSKNKEDSVSQKAQLRHLFAGLKMVAFGMFVGAIALLITLHFLDVSKSVEFFTLLFFGLASGAFLLGRGRSILLSYEEAVTKTKRARHHSDIQNVDAKQREGEINEP